MSMAVLIALLGFAFAASFTPGPNNLMLMAAGANFGFRRALPHMAGIIVGVAILMLLVGAGLMALFEAYPIMPAFKVLCVVYMLYLAFRIATAAPVAQQEEAGRPFTFLQAASFQWVNPKAWAMALSAMALYAPDGSWWAVVIIAGVFAAVGAPAISTWTWLGTVASQFLSSASRLRAFNIAMAVLLVLSLYPVLSME